MIWANNQLWQYSKNDSTKIVALLDEAKNEKEDTNFPLYFANKFIGIRYVASTLERNKTEKLVINLQELDCTTLVEKCSCSHPLCKNKAIHLQTVLHFSAKDSLRQWSYILSHPTSLFL